METEAQTRSVNNLTPRISETARLLWRIYIGLTALMVATLFGLHLVGLAPEMTLFDAVAHAFTAVSTSGFSPRPDSIAAFSPAVQWAVIPFMATGATSFVLVFFILGAIFVVVNESRTAATVGEFEAMSATAATFFNVGPAFGIAGPFESYAPFSPATKLLLTVLRWVGRIEIVPVLVLLTPWYWAR